MATRIYAHRGSHPRTVAALEAYLKRSGIKGLRRLSWYVRKGRFDTHHYVTDHVAHGEGRCLGVYPITVALAVGTNKNPDEQFWGLLEGKKPLPFEFKIQAVKLRDEDAFALFVTFRALWFWLKKSKTVGLERKSACAANRWALARLEEAGEGGAV